MSVPLLTDASKISAEKEREYTERAWGMRGSTCWSGVGAESPCSSRGWFPAEPWRETWGRRWTEESPADCSRFLQTEATPSLQTHHQSQYEYRHRNLFLHHNKLCEVLHPLTLFSGEHTSQCTTVGFPTDFRVFPALQGALKKKKTLMSIRGSCFWKS